MGAGDAPADALSDLRTENNALSVWIIESDHASLNMALAALASNREKFDKLDYTLIDEGILRSIPIAWVSSDGS
jgi:hypothetical protein